MADAPAPKKGKGKKTPKNTKIILIAVGGALGVFALYKVYEDYKANNSAATTTAEPDGTSPEGTGGTGGTDPNATTTASSTPLSEAGWIESAVSALTAAGIDPTDAYNSILDWLNGEPISNPAAATALGTFLSSGGGLNSLPSGLNINPITTSTSGSSTPTVGATGTGGNAGAAAEQDTNAAVVNQDGTIDTAAVKALTTATKNLQAAIAKGESAAKITALSDNVAKAQNTVNQRDAAASGVASAPTGTGTLTLLKAAQAAITKITAKAATVAPKVVAPVAAPKAAAPASVAVKAPSQKASAAKVVIPVQAKKA